MFSYSFHPARVHGDREPPRCGGVLQQRCQYLAGTRQVRGGAGNARQALDIRTRILGGDNYLGVASSYQNLAALQPILTSLNSTNDALSTHALEAFNVTLVK